MVQKKEQVASRGKGNSAMKRFCVECKWLGICTHSDDDSDYVFYCDKDRWSWNDLSVKTEEDARLCFFKAQDCEDFEEWVK